MPGAAGDKNQITRLVSTHSSSNAGALAAQPMMQLAFISKKEHTVTEIQILLDYDIFGEDNGAGGLKLYGRHGGIELPAQVALHYAE